ncbi:hypothetical protein BD311DRAFT_614541, partial [Dichomitus squalens]
LSKTDDWSGAQLLQALADLNLEIIQLSASVAEEFATNARREHAQDPTLVLFALQPWEVWCVTR